MIFCYNNTCKEHKNQLFYMEVEKCIYFLAHYINMDTGEKITRGIEFDSACSTLETEKEIYLYVMARAYDMRQYNECFDSLEFIAG